MDSSFHNDNCWPFWLTQFHDTKHFLGKLPFYKLKNPCTDPIPLQWLRNAWIYILLKDWSADKKEKKQSLKTGTIETTRMNHHFKDYKKVQLPIYNVICKPQHFHFLGHSSLQLMVLKLHELSGHQSLVICRISSGWTQDERRIILTFY